MASYEDKCYELAALEVANQDVQLSVWGRAFSEALGQKEVTLALYIKLRVSQLVVEHDAECQRALKQALLNKEFIVCMKCDQQVKARVHKFEPIVFSLLYLLYVLPGFLYAIYFSFLPKVRYFCPKCSNLFLSIKN